MVLILGENTRCGYEKEYVLLIKLDYWFCRGED